MLAFLAIVSTLAVPYVEGFILDQKLKSDAAKLAVMLRAARTEAIIKGKEEKIEFSPYDNSHRYLGTRYRLHPGIRYVGTTTFKEGGYNVPYCAFLPSGAPKSGGTVTLANSKGKKLFIIVSVAAGRVRVSDKPPSNWEIRE